MLAAVQRAGGPGVSEADRDLVLLAADQWLRSRGASQEAASRGRGLGEAWARLGFHSYSAQGSSWEYCGSILDSLAARVGRNEWADLAFLLLLDSGWVSGCGGDFEGAEFGNDLFAPVLARGEAFLAAHLDAPVRNSVALRVALAHETVWSLSKRIGVDDFYADLKATAPGHRRRALELYRDLAGHTRDAEFRRAIRSRIRSLETGADTKCTVYYLEGEC